MTLYTITIQTAYERTYKTTNAVEAERFADMFGGKITMEESECEINLALS